VGTSPRSWPCLTTWPTLRSGPAGPCRARHRRQSRAGRRPATPGPGPGPGAHATAAGHRRTNPGTAGTATVLVPVFHQLPIADELIDGRTDAVRRYLRHFWTHWSGPGFTLTDDHLVSVYAEPGAFTASIGWYRVGTGALARVAAEQAPQPAQRITAPTTVLRPDHDPLFPFAWSDRLDQFFANLRLQHVDSGHFLPLERPEVFATAVAAATTASSA
jgi:pimeloyl-ACP methyl ester carboxylesterase